MLIQLKTNMCEMKLSIATQNKPQDFSNILFFMYRYIDGLCHGSNEMALFHFTTSTPALVVVLTTFTEGLRNSMFLLTLKS